MALLDILVYPDARLRQKATDVDVFDNDLRQLVDDMAQTMYHAPGIGLAAVQVNVLKRVIVIDISDSRDQLMVLINPVIVEQQGECETEEGCLSVPDIYASVTRASEIEVSFQDATGTSHRLEAEGLLAVCIQHEIDHLDGKVFVDYLSRLKQDRIKKRLQKHSRKPLDQPAAATL